MDTHVAAHLINAVHAVRLLGAQTIITGIGAAAASNLVTLGIELEDVKTRRRLADGLRAAFELINLAVRHQPESRSSSRDSARASISSDF